MRSGDRHTGTVVISLRLTPEAVADIEAAAAAEGKSRHAYLVELVEAARRAWQELVDMTAAELAEHDEFGPTPSAASIMGAPRFFWFEKGDRAGG